MRWPAQVRRRGLGCQGHVLAAAFALAAAALSVLAVAACFVPAAPSRAPATASHSSSGGRGAGHSWLLAAGSGGQGSSGEAGYAPYDWQRVAEGGGAAKPAAAPGAAAEPGALNLDALPDLPDFSEDEDEVISDEAKAAPMAATVRTRELRLPDLPGDSDLLPPEPNPMTQGLGLLEWTGIWIGGLLVVAAIGGVGSYALARAKLDPEFADSALQACKAVFTIFQVLFLGRVLLTQFPKIKTTEMPWAFVHYPTEWALAPTRMIFPPEAGVDIAPILWLAMTLLASELLTGPAGILQLAKNAPTNGMPQEFSIR